MTLLFKHNFRFLAITFLVTTTILLAVAWLVKSPKLLEIVLSHGVSLKIFLLLSFYRIPAFLELLLPLSFLFATLYSLHHLNLGSELIAMRAGGMSHIRTSLPIMTLALILCLFSFFLTFYATPSGYRIVRDLQHQVGANILLAPIRQGEFNKVGKNVIFYVPTQDSKALEQGLFIHDSRNHEKEITFIAEKGQMQKIDNGLRFKLTHGKRQELDRDGKTLSNFAFDYYVFDLALNAPQEKTRRRRVEERWMNELRHPEQDANEDERRAYRIEIHRRTLLPLSIMLYGLIILAFFAAQDVGRRGDGRIILSTSLIVFALHIGLLGMIRLSNQLPWLIHATYLLLGFMAFMSLAYLFNSVPFDRVGHHISKYGRSWQRKLKRI